MAILVHAIVLLVLAFSYCTSSSTTVTSYRKELRTKNQLNQKFDKHFESSPQPARVDPSRVIQLSSRPRVFLYRGFLSDEECNHLISLAHGKAGTTLLNDVDSWNMVDSNQLTTSVKPLGVEQDEIVAGIEDRICAWTFLPKGNSDPMQIMHFVHEDTKDHLDYYGDKARLGSGEPLMATVVLYLSNVTQGGEALFLKSESKTPQPNDDTWSDCAKKGYAVKPIKGNALLSFNLQPSTAPDESSSNARCPVLQGEKWCATKFFHLRAIEVKKALLESGSDDCTDEEDSCPQWASLGECEKNPLYMKGTPDYSGSCRKSCNSC